MSHRISRVSPGTKYSEHDIKQFFKKVQMKRKSEVVTLSNDKMLGKYKVMA